MGTGIRLELAAWSPAKRDRLPAPAEQGWLEPRGRRPDLQRLPPVPVRLHPPIAGSARGHSVSGRPSERRTRNQAVRSFQNLLVSIAWMRSAARWAAAAP